MIRRVWAMPNSNTFAIKPIGQFVQSYLTGVSVDPFARDTMLATYRNDLNPNTAAEYHMDAVAFLDMLHARGVVADTVLFDPPYSPRQISECYAAAGLKAGMADTQNARANKACRDAIRRISKPGTVVLSFAWNSVGMGADFETEEMLIVCHGGAHNDTICLAQRRIECAQIGAFDSAAA